MKQKPSIGDKSWSVNWCAGIPLDENGDADHDKADDRCDRYRTLASARIRADEVLPLDYFGCVQIHECEFVPYDDADAVEFPHAGFWREIADPIIVE